MVWMRKCKKYLAIVLALIMALCGFWVEKGVAGVSAEGVWIEITDSNGLDAIRNNLSANYKLMADIDLNGANWAPIGSESSSFTGILDGNSKVIRNFKIDNTAVNNQGLFSYIGATGEIRNLGIEGANITAGDYAGILGGTNSGTITRCYAKGNVNGSNYVGGLVGSNTNNISNCFSTVYVSGKDYVGGLAGSNSGTIDKCYSSSQIKPSVFNNFLQFDGVNDYIEIPHNPSYATDQFTLEAWFQWDDIGTDKVQFITAKEYENFEIHTGGGSGIDGIRFIPIPNLKDGNGQSTGDSWIDVPDSLQAGWFHVAAVYDFANDQAKVYINGVAQDLYQNEVSYQKGSSITVGKTASLPRDTNSLSENTYPFNIGRRVSGGVGSSYFKGKICDVRFWNIARTAEQIEADKNKQLAGNEDNLIGYWKLNEGTGTTAKDSTGKSNGTVYGATWTKLSDATYMGGLVGYNTKTVSNSYYDSEVSGQSDNTGKGVPKTTNEMKLGFSTWDFTNIWGIHTGTNGGYPYLLSATKDIISFNFAGLDPVVTGVVDDGAGTINLTVPYGTDLTKLTPTITHTGSSVLPASGAEIDFSGSEATPVKYTVTAADNSTQDYYVTVNLPDFAAGDGSEGNPYQITKLEHLNNIRNHLDKHFILMNDLDFNNNSSYLNLNNKTTWTTGSGWQPIGTDGYTPFVGSINGNGHLINGLYINRYGNSYVGLFGYNGGLIKELGLTNVNITGTRVGAIAANNHYRTNSTVKGEIESCFVSGNIQGQYDVGGLIGWNIGKVSNSYAVVSVMGTANNVGGIAGRAGMDGSPDTSFVSCFATGRIYGTTKDIGGINGVNMPGTSVTYTNCYYDSRSTGLSGGFGTGLSTVQMKQQANFTGFDFGSTWGITDGVTFPYLRWQSSQTDQAWPAFKDAVPSIDNIKSGSMDLHLETDENGMVHYVVVDAKYSEPTVAEIKNGTGSGGIATISHGSISVTADTPIVESIANSPVIQTQKVYIVTEDSIGSLQLVPDSFTFVNAAAPEITDDLTDKTTVEGTGITLDATATVSDGGTLSYVWYSADDRAKTNAQAIEGETNATYIPSVEVAGQFYYYCEVTNTNNAVTGVKTAVTTSAISKVTVQAFVNAAAPEITDDLTDKTTVEGTGITLDATATVSDGGTLSYVWYSAEDAAKTNAQVIEGATNATYTPSVEVAGQFYYYCEVTNTNNAVTGVKTAVTTSAVSKVTVVEAVPGAPQIQLVIAGDGYVNITWSEVNGAIGYKIFSSTTSGVYGNKPAMTVTDSVYSCDIMGLENGIEYYFTIKAINQGGDSTFSNEMSATPQVDVPGVPELKSAVAGDKHVNISWSGITGATKYKIFSSTTSGHYGGEPITVTDSVYGYDVTGLTNGITYYFVVSAENPGGDSAYSNEISATPMSVPGVPTDVTAEAGDRQAMVSFTAPEDNGGSPITGYIVTANPGGKTATGADTSITITGLINGKAYTFTVKAVNAVGEGKNSGASNTVIPHRDDSEHKNTSTKPAKPLETGVKILVNGKLETAATSVTVFTAGKTVTTITVDDKKVGEKLKAEGNNAVVTIFATKDEDVVVGQLNGQTVRNMESNEAVLEVKTGNVTYTLPAAQINIDNVSSQIGEKVELEDIAVNILISKPTQDTVRIVEDTANRNNYHIVVRPVEFSITCTNGNKTVEVSRFKGYVERTLAIPEGVNPSRITTGIVLNPDGTFSHVPTTIIVVDGKYYAKINSLTNSTYSVIYSEKTFKDIENHWAKDAVNDMGSRLVIDGTGEGKFEPDSDMTRAEFAAIMVRALGLMRPEMGKDIFSDVTKADWYYDAVSIAYEYGIISGYSSHEFGPTDKVTREQAMIMIARAMDITGMTTTLANVEINKLIENFIDANVIADYAKNSVAVNIKAGIVTGRNTEALAPKDNITRAEATVIIRRLLQVSGLI